VRAASVDEVAAALRDTRGPVLPHGTRTKLDWGAPGGRVEVDLDLTGLAAVVEHNPGDLVVRVQAGARLADLQARLETHRQRLALDPPLGGTVGGITATNAAGPLRHRFGAPRDLLIGVTVVRADGVVAKAGGKVVKNVAGYDLMKLFCGSWGTLGVVVETAWRLHPLPAAVRAVLVADEDPVPVVRRLVRSRLAPSAVELSGCPGQWTVTVLFEGGERAVTEQAASVGGGRVLDHRPEGLGAWPGTPVVLKVAHAPSGLRALLDALPPGARLTHAAAVGVGLVGLPGEGTAGGAAATVAALRAALAAYDGSVVVLRAPDAVKRAVDVWGDVGDALPLMRRVKRQFDPDGVFAAGRFVGGI
jgi:glycolate oxidase FAD binding subunit